MLHNVFFLVLFEVCLFSKKNVVVTLIFLQMLQMQILGVALLKISEPPFLLGLRASA